MRKAKIAHETKPSVEDFSRAMSEEGQRSSEGSYRISFACKVLITLIFHVLRLSSTSLKKLIIHKENVKAVPGLTEQRREYQYEKRSIENKTCDLL